MNVGEFCTRGVAVASPGDSVCDAARRMREESLGTLVVVDELQRPLGIATDRDLALRCLAEAVDPARTPLSRVMSGPVAWVHQDTPVDAALEEMARLRVRRLVVVDPRDRLIGILALDDVLVAQTEADTPLGRAVRAAMP